MPPQQNCPCDRNPTVREELAKHSLKDLAQEEEHEKPYPESDGCDFVTQFCDLHVALFTSFVIFTWHFLQTRN